LEDRLIFTLDQTHDHKRPFFFFFGVLVFDFAHLQKQRIFLIIKLKYVKNLTRIGMTIFAFKRDHRFFLLGLLCFVTHCNSSTFCLLARAASVFSSCSVPSAISSSPSWNLRSGDGLVISLPL